MSGRRLLIWCGVWCGVGFGIAPAWGISLSAPTPQPCHLDRGDGRLLLFSYPHREIAEIAVGGATTAQIQRIMRSPDGASHPIDPRLIRLLDQIQDHFAVETVELISGYRSPGYNARLQAEGHAVATESLHMQGLAADIHLDAITEAAVRDYARDLGCGGVGYYPSQHFVHVDLGPVRSWEAPLVRRKLVGEGPIDAITPRNVYRAGDAVSWTPPAPMTPQFFRRGQWQEVSSMAGLRPPLRLRHPLPFGKYRLHTVESPHGYSNEFYFKRL